MSEEVKNEEKKLTFKEKFKRVLPWVLGTVGTVGGSVLAYKLGKFVAESNEQIQKDNSINKYLLDTVNDIADGGNYCIAVTDQDGKETFATIQILDEKPEWFEKGYELTTESYFSNLVTTVGTDKE